MQTAKRPLALLAACLLSASAYAQSDVDLLSETVTNLDDATTVVLDALKQEGLDQEAEDVEKQYRETRKNIQSEIERQLAAIRDRVRSANAYFGSRPVVEGNPRRHDE